MKIIYKDYCKICGKLKDLKNHIKEHKISTKEYYDKYLRKPDENCYCKVCGKEKGFAGLAYGYPSIYCSAKCQQSDTDLWKKHSESMKNRTDDEKAETRKKQIETWTKTMGDDWSKIMSQHACESYDKKHLDEDGNPISTGGPFASKDVRKKCEESWGNVTSPACNQDVRDKISESVQALMNDYEFLKSHYYDKKLQKLQNLNNNIIDFDGNLFTYKCPDCNEITKITTQYIFRRLKHNVNLCFKCVPKNGTSVQEKEVLSYIREFYTDNIIENDKTILNGKELDIVLPDIKIAFEFDGTYWHMDPRIYDENDFNGKRQATAKEIWER